MLLGGDIGPRNSVQIILATFGVFMGSLINANIFGELSVIIGGMGRDEKEFQSNTASMNTAMINIKLPEDLRQLIRDDNVRN